MKKNIIFFLLRLLTKGILKKYKPEVIGLTGSVGKTSAKNAIYTVLAPNHNVRASSKNYNTETGVPLSVIKADNPGRSIFGWLKIFTQALSLLLKRDKNYPQILILEMAADKPGDIKYLTNLTRPNVGIVTSISSTHLEFFKTPDKVGEEKIYLVNNLKTNACAIINNDSPIIKKLFQNNKPRLLTYGLDKNSDLYADNIIIDKTTGQLSFNLNYQGSATPVSLQALGKPAVYAALVAAAVGIYHNINLTAISARLKNYTSPPGRLKILPGIKGTRLIDDSYNSSPLAAKSALEILSHLTCEGEKYAVLGDMLELGDETEKLHKEVGEEVARLGLDYLITVGAQSLATNEAAEEYGMNPDRIFNFDTASEAGKFIQDRMETNDLILIKGSRGMHMEKITKEIMAEPAKAKELLVGQEEE